MCTQADVADPFAIGTHFVVCVGAIAALRKHQNSESSKKSDGEHGAIASANKVRKYLEEQMTRHFFGEGADQASGYVPPAGS
jgi:hypothetical protein